MSQADFPFLASVPELPVSVRRLRDIAMRLLLPGCPLPCVLQTVTPSGRRRVSQTRKAPAPAVADIRQGFLTFPVSRRRARKAGDSAGDDGAARGANLNAPAADPDTPRSGAARPAGRSSTFQVRPAASIVATVKGKRTEAGRESIPSQARHNSRKGMNVSKKAR
jgi:hypothetical protein